jgi:hypothetical protein
MAQTPTTVRDWIRYYQREIAATDLQPDQAANILTKLTALIGNCNDEVREADAEYAQHLLRCYDVEKKANRAKLVAETSPEYDRKRRARDARELVIELIRSLMFFLKSKQD